VRMRDDAGAGQRKQRAEVAPPPRLLEDRLSRFFAILIVIPKPWSWRLLTENNMPSRPHTVETYLLSLLLQEIGRTRFLDSQ
jgi:hypothetical protein